MDDKLFIGLSCYCKAYNTWNRS